MLNPSLINSCHTKFLRPFLCLSNSCLKVAVMGAKFHRFSTNIPLFDLLPIIRCAFLFFPRVDTRVYASNYTLFYYYVHFEYLRECVTNFITPIFYNDYKLYTQLQSHLHKKGRAGGRVESKAEARR